MSGGPFGPRRYSIDDDGSVGYLTGRDQVDFAPYDEPPPPYTFWKPPESYFPQEEAPPPYDAHYHINVGIGTVTGNGNNRGSVGIGDNNNAVDNHQREIMTSVRVPAPIPTPYSPVRSASIHHCPGQDISVTRGQPVCNSSPLQRVAIPSLSQVSVCCLLMFPGFFFALATICGLCPYI